MSLSLEPLAAVLSDCNAEATAPGNEAAPLGTPASKPHELSLLEALPVELLIQVADCLRERQDLAALVRTARHIYRATNGLLYTKTLRSKPSGLLHWAAERGGLETARVALQAGADPNETWFSEQTRDEAGPHSVSPFGHAHRLAKLASLFLGPADSYLGAVSRPTRTPWRYWTPLHVAVYFGHSEMAELLLAHGAALEFRAVGLCPCPCRHFTRRRHAGHRDIECTPLHVAICRGHMGIARMLLTRGAPAATAFDNREYYQPSPGRAALRVGLPSPMTALHQAAYGGQLALANFILDGRYQDVDAKDFFGQTPLHYAAARKYWAVVQRLVDRGADINAATSSAGDIYLRMTALHMAIDWVDYRSALQLVHLGADVQVETVTRMGQQRFTPLMMMVRSTQDHLTAELLQAIIARGGKLETRLDNTGRTPLEEAAVRHSTTAMRELLAAGSQIRDSLYLVCDHQASDWYSGKNAIELLLQHHADVNEIFLTPAGPRTALYVLCVGRSATRDIDIKREYFSSVLDRYDMASKLVAAGAVPNPPGFDNGWSKPLLRCFRRSEYDIISLLVSEGVAISTQDLDAMFESACNRRALDGIEYLAQLSKVAGHEGYIPAPGQKCLLGAFRDENMELIEAIHGFGIVPTETIDGLTPLHQACRHPWVFYDYAKKLVEEGADVNVRASANETPLTFALAWKLNFDFDPLNPLDGQGSRLAELILENGGRWIWPSAENVLRPGTSVPALCPIQSAVIHAIPINKVSYSGFESLEALLAKYPLILPSYPSQYLESFYSECQSMDRPEYLYHGTRLFIHACVTPKQRDRDGPTVTLLHLLRTMVHWDAATRWKDIVILALAALQEDGARWELTAGDERPADFVHIRGKSDELDALAVFLRSILSLKRGADDEILAVFKKPANLNGWDTKKDTFLQRLLRKLELWGKPGALLY